MTPSRCLIILLALLALLPIVHNHYFHMDMALILHADSVCEDDQNDFKHKKLMIEMFGQPMKQYYGPVRFGAPLSPFLERFRIGDAETRVTLIGAQPLVPLTGDEFTWTNGLAQMEPRDQASCRTNDPWNWRKMQAAIGHAHWQLVHNNNAPNKPRVILIVSNADDDSYYQDSSKYDVPRYREQDGIETFMVQRLRLIDMIAYNRQTGQLNRTFWPNAWPFFEKLSAHKKLTWSFDEYARGFREEFMPWFVQTLANTFCQLNRSRCFPDKDKACYRHEYSPRAYQYAHCKLFVGGGDRGGNWDGRLDEKCEPQECTKHCDDVWPWNGTRTDCSRACGPTQLYRKGSPPYVDTNYCPAEFECPPCEVESSKRKPEESSAGPDDMISGSTEEPDDDNGACDVRVAGLGWWSGMVFVGCAILWQCCGD